VARWEHRHPPRVKPTTATARSHAYAPAVAATRVTADAEGVTEGSVIPERAALRGWEQRGRARERHCAGTTSTPLNIAMTPECPGQERRVSVSRVAKVTTDDFVAPRIIRPPAAAGQAGDGIAGLKNGTRCR
jgi:hypothetical protein